jgi:uncharacterized LabA/DUF88 family protein
LGEQGVTALESRIALFIDGANLHATAKTLGFDIDYKRPWSNSLYPDGFWALAAARRVTRCEVYMVLDGAERLCAAAQGTIMMRWE